MTQSTISPANYIIIKRKGVKFTIIFNENIVQSTYTDEYNISHTLYNYDEYEIKWDIPATFINNSETVSTYVYEDDGKTINEESTKNNALIFVSLNLDEIKGYAINSYY